MKEQFEKLSLVYYRVSAVDGKKVFQDAKDDYTKGWLACFASHIKIIKKMLKRNFFI